MYASYVERLWKEERKRFDRLEINEELNLHSWNHLLNEEQTVLFYNQN